VKRRRNLLGLPFAPATVPGGVRRRFQTLGRKDAKKYKNIQDFSRTHALLEAEAMAQAGQHTVNQWLFQRVQPIIAGNARIELPVREVETDLQNLKSARAAAHCVQASLAGKCALCLSLSNITSRVSHT
jgi:hypothetical protein